MDSETIEEMPETDLKALSQPGNRWSSKNIEEKIEQFALVTAACRAARDNWTESEALILVMTDVPGGRREKAQAFARDQEKGSADYFRMKIRQSQILADLYRVRLSEIER